MEKIAVPDAEKKQVVRMVESSTAEGRTGSFLGSEIMPAVTIRISMPPGAAVPAEAASPTSPKATPQAASQGSTQAAPTQTE